MKVLIIVPQCRPEPTLYPPYGALYIASWLIQNGHESEIFNMDINRYSVSDMIDKLHEYHPDVIGISGIVSTSYKYVKQIARAIKEEMANIPVILGGQLSRAADTVLKNTAVDYVVIGEGEVIILSLLAAIKEQLLISDVKGIAYIDNGEVKYTEPGDQIRDLDSLSSPMWELIEMDKYLIDPLDRWGPFIKGGAKFSNHFYENIEDGVKSFTIMTGRGCSDWCTFCSRNMKGLRKHSQDFILNMIEYLKNTFNVKYFVFGDESFISNKKWVYEFIDKLKARNLQIAFYVLGARVDTVDRNLLIALKDAGCFMIEYGFEHGSQRMLDMMEKRSTVAENYRVYKMTKDIGLFTVPANVINMPGETNETIKESVRFLQSLKDLGTDNPANGFQYFVNYAQAHPGTPLFDYAVQTGMIENQDTYLENISDLNAGDFQQAIKKGVYLNFSGRPLEEVLSWSNLFRPSSRPNDRENIVKKVYRHIGLIFSMGIMKYSRRYGRVLNQRLSLVVKRFEAYMKAPLDRDYYQKGLGIFSKKIRKSAAGETTVHNPQIGLDDDSLIIKIKKFKYDKRERKKMNIGRFTMEYYVDLYDGLEIVRYPSLRSLIFSLQSQCSSSLIIPTDTKQSMRKVHTAPLSQLIK